jgi:hypothetical protein
MDFDSGNKDVDNSVALIAKNNGKKQKIRLYNTFSSMEQYQNLWIF